jgi:hypothetical protein
MNREPVLIVWCSEWNQMLQKLDLFHVMIGEMQVAVSKICEGDSGGAELCAAAELAMATSTLTSRTCHGNKYTHQQNCVQQQNLPWRQVHSPTELCAAAELAMVTSTLTSRSV